MKKKLKNSKPKVKFKTIPTNKDLICGWIKDHFKSKYCVIWMEPSGIALSFDDVKLLIKDYIGVINVIPYMIVMPNKTKDDAIDLYNKCKKVGVGPYIYIWLPKKGLQNDFI